MRANHAVFDPIFIQYIIIQSGINVVQGWELIRPIKAAGAKWQPGSDRRLI
jgi:hypothetical protein